MLTTAARAELDRVARRSRALVIVSSRPIGVRSRAARRAWSSSASGASGCSKHARPNASSAREVVGVVERVAPVRVDLERDVGSDLGAHRGDDVDVVAGRDLQLHAAGSPRPTYPADQLAASVARDRRACRSRPRRRRGCAVPPRCAASETPVGAELRVEHARRRARPWRRGARARRRVGAREQARHQLVAEHEPRGVERVGRVRRRRSRRVHSPQPSRVGGDDADEQRVLRRVVLDAVRNGCDQRQPTAEELDRRGRQLTRDGSVNASEPGHSARAHEIDRSVERDGQRRLAGFVPVRA